MITDLKIENYKSLKELNLKLNPLNVIIGPNGSGKTNFLDLFQLFSYGAKGILTIAIEEHGGFDSIFFSSSEKNKSITFEIVFELDKKEFLGFLLKLEKFVNTFRIADELIAKIGNKNPLVYRDIGKCSFVDERSPLVRAFSLIDSESKELEQKNITKDSEFAIFQIRDENRYPTAYKINKYLEEIAVYPPFDVSFDSLVRRPQLIRPGTRLTQSGSNLFSVLYNIQQNHPPVWEEIVEIVQSIYHDFNRFTFPAEGGDGKIIMRWWEKPFQEFGFSPHMISDGTMRLLCLIAILKSPDPAPLICIDEPEIGLHPEWIKLVGELLEEASTRTQLIVATHSPELISKIKPENIIVCEKEDGATVMERLNEKELATWLEKYTLGELWLSGHFGGK